MKLVQDCIYCGENIPEERLEFLKETGRSFICTKCSIEKPKMGLMDYGHKTAPQMVILPNNEEVQRIAVRAFRRAR